MSEVPAEWHELNRAAWDERVAIHLGPGGYDLAPLRAGSAALDPICDAEIGDVAGLRVLHLQCHIGHNTLALARRGAHVTGLDFSEEAIAACRAMATELGLPARFVQADLYDAPAAIPGPASFDLVFTTWGTICWLPDIAGWARVVAGFLKPGGALYFADAHPTAYIFDDMAGASVEGKPGWFDPYLARAGLPHDDFSDYANPDAVRTHTRQVTWLHPLGDIVNALIEAGLRLEWLHEHPRLTWKMFRDLVQDGEGMWTWSDRPWLPLAMSLRAVRDD